MSLIFSVAATDQGLLVAVEAADPVLLSWRWLRDHGEDESSFDPATRQRRVYAIGVDEPKAAHTASLSTIEDTEVMVVEWPEEPTSTWISCRTLAALLAPEAKQQPTLWSSPEDASIAIGEVEQVLTNDDSLRDWLDDLARVGFAQLSGFSGGHDAAAAIADRIGYVRTTIFASTWDLASDIAGHDDTAYSQSFLAPHTDGTYSHDAPGLQMFCCTERDGSGGESIVVDAFAVAATLRTEFPQDFDTLTKVSVPGHYIEAGVELRASRPAIRLDAAGAVAQISMNNYDRSPMHLPADEMDAFYRAYGRLHDLANDESRWMSIRLEPGDVLINDNWRVLHGRQAYTGARRFVGCYLNHEDFESRCRTLGLTYF